MTQINIQEILRCLPHRYPFILIDRVLDYKSKETLLALKNVTINEPFFNGHFPGQPIMPGVLILEALAQACVILAHQSLEAPPGKSLLHLFAGVDNARFKQVVIPGDQLHLKVDFVSQKRGIWRMHGEASVDAKTVCIADFLSAAKEY